MFLSSASLIAVLLALVLLIVTTSARKKTPPGSKLPPGPSGYPLVGNLPSIPQKHSWLQFYEWSKTYGPLYRLNIAGREHFIISTESIANDLCRDRGAIYSSREQLPAAVGLLSDNLRPLFWPYGETQRQGRKLMHQLCQPSVATTYETTQVVESTRLLEDLIRKPEGYEDWFMRYSAGVIFRIGFGKVITLDSPFLKRIFGVVHTVERVASPGAYLVDTFPLLARLPDFIAPFKRELKALHAEELDVFRTLLQDTKADMEKGKASECWEKMYLERKDEYRLTEDEGAYVVGTLFEAGAGTTAAAMMSLMLALTLYPEELEKLQNDIDTVVGESRLPSFDDISKLPRVRAVVKEVLRWRPVTAGGLPHMCTRDDTYTIPNGETVFIPAGTNIHPNQWAIHRDPELYPQSDDFLPKRWLEEGWPTYKEPLSTFPNITHFSSFGFGRRICPGMHIAERSLYLLTARIAWTCNWRKKRGHDGKEIEPPLYDYVDGFNVQPKWFPFDLEVRSEERMAIVRRAREEADRTDPLASR